MLISGNDVSRQAPVASMAATDDGQSARQLNVVGTTNAAGSEAPTTSFRNLGTVDRCTSSSQRRGNLVLFVKSNDNESDAPSRTFNNASINGQPNGGGSGDSSVNSQAEDGEEGGDGEQEDIVSLVVSTASSVGATLMNAVTGAARKPLLTAAIVLLYFILLDIVLLQNNERLNRLLRRMRATDDDAMVLLTSSLMRQMKDAQKDLFTTLALRDPPATLERLELLQHKSLALERVCNRSLQRLHTKLMFPGSVEDLSFLVEEHVDFDAQLQQLAREELEWTRTVLSTSIVQSHSGDAQDSYHSTSGGAVRRDEDGDDDAVDKSDADALTNPLRNVRLERVTKPGTPSSGAQPHLVGQGKRRLVQNAAARRRAAKLKGKAAVLVEDVEEVEVVAGGLLDLLKNRFVAFVLICVCLAAVLRMG